MQTLMNSKKLGLMQQRYRTRNPAGKKRTAAGDSIMEILGCALETAGMRIKKRISGTGLTVLA